MLPDRMFEIRNLSLSFGEKVLIEDFSTIVGLGDRIAIMGRNGSGKTTLFKHISEHNECMYIPQFLNTDGSGGERFMSAFHSIQKEIRCGWGSQLLLLDEPTNHLDEKNRRQLFRELQRYDGALICISHDVELLGLFEIFWHIAEGEVKVFRGRYEDYMRERERVRKQDEESYSNLIKERERLKNVYRKVQGRRQNAQTQRNIKNEKLRQLKKEQEELTEKIAEQAMPQGPVLNFWMQWTPARYSIPISIRNGSVSRNGKQILSKINISISWDDRILLKGPEQV